MDGNELLRALRENTAALERNTTAQQRLALEFGALRASANEPPPPLEDALGDAAAGLAEGAVRSFFSGTTKGKRRRKT